ncbi:hypothetical protein [Paenibacillus sp. URB8-2]|uniref:hypothetical protein n=1 Tax=Paenibacillus sp. URB8-2 TaxID=2741301 RepID=UPI0015BBE0C8|nr:hypothetical protein [Paenibacillus sp. URB8-2]BCG60964.1 hypothetical protein PUR_43890 [Paenibacillus sp. URB8-2]
MKDLNRFTLNRLVNPEEIKRISHSDLEVIEAFIHSLITQFTAKLNEQEAWIREPERRSGQN